MDKPDEQGIRALSELEEYLSYSSVNPQHRYFVKTDNVFTRKARLLQAMRRKESGAACGYVSKNEITYYHPNLATDGDVTGCNFLSPQIFEYALWRVRHKKPYETIQEDRLFNNFLSSQPMAFNLFVPLMEIVQREEGKERLAAVVTRLLDCQEGTSISRITEVGIEFIPPYHQECLHDRTAMDAFFRYERADGGQGIMAIETKYTDILGTNQASNPAFAVRQATENDGISRLFTQEGVDGIRKGDIKLSQVYRNFLLTETVRLHEHLDDSMSIVLSPGENTSNRAEESRLLAILKDAYKYKFQTVTLERFLSALTAEFTETDIFRKFGKRYLDFTQAERLISDHGQRRHEQA